MINTVKTENFEMNYCRFGGGDKNFVIIPGLSLFPVTPSEEAISKLFADLTEDFTVYLFDRKKNAPSNYSTEEMAEDAFCAMKKIGIESATLYGASQGGMIAEYIAINHPEFAKKLVLASTVGRVNPTLYEKIDSWTKLALKSDGYALNEKLCRDIYSEGTFNAYRDALLKGGENVPAENMVQFANVAPAILTFDAYDKLNRIKCPVLVLGSEGDTVMTPAGIRELISALSCESYFYGAEYGHAVYDEAPDFVKRIYEFIKK